MRIKVLLILIICTFTLVLSTSPVAADAPEVKDSGPVRTFDNQGKGPDTGRVMIVTNSAVSDSMREELRKHGKIHGEIADLNIVAITPNGQKGREAIEALSFVTSVTKDGHMYLTGTSTFDLDLINAADNEESYDDPPDPGDNDPRLARTGKGVEIAIIDTGLPRNWRDFLPESQVNTELARAFIGGGATAETFVPADPKDSASPKSWGKDTSGHGMVVASILTGFKAVGSTGTFNFDGVAPDATIIPISVFPSGDNTAAWESHVIAALNYITQLKKDGVIGPVVVNMSLGSPDPNPLTKAAVDAAIAEGIIVVASAGNEGESRMGYPGAYSDVISVGAVGWTEQFQDTVPDSNGDFQVPKDRFWLLEDVPEDPNVVKTQVYVPDFSSRAITGDGQELDGVAPGVRIVKPDGHGPNASIFFEDGTSFAAPMVSGIAALMLEKNPNLRQLDGPGGGVQAILKATALDIADSGNETVKNRSGNDVTYKWDTDCNGSPCDPVGAGLFQADAAVAATP